jgi:flagellar basal-body rod protein FlgC
MFDTFDISSSALTAERFRMNIISNNIANANTTRTPEGGPYKRQLPVFEAREASFSDMLESEMMGTHEPVGNGVRVVGVVDDDSPFKTVYDPGHPDADKNGYVKMPNVDVVKEMVDLISASRAYEANLSLIDTTKSLVQRALSIGK